MPWTMTHGFKFTRKSITGVPNESGVFGLYNEEGWVFIESCSNLQEALLRYLDKSLEYFWPDEPNSYTVKICDAAESEEKRDQLILLVLSRPKLTLRQQFHHPWSGSQFNQRTREQAASY